MKNYLFICLQYLLPQHLLSRCAGKLAASKTPWIKNYLIRSFKHYFNIDLSEAKCQDPLAFNSFNDFFCRELTPGARPISDDRAAIVSPADGCFSQVGKINNGQIIQAKGQYFSVQNLLADQQAASMFLDGDFATIYLSPRDYHRVHMPFAGRLLSTTYVPGKLFSVNTATTEKVPNLFARNERLVCMFETDTGPMAVVLVGAMIVASIETAWSGEVAPSSSRKITKTEYNSEVYLNKGDEVGRFKLGSTVILLFPNDQIKWQESIGTGSHCTMGKTIAKYL